MCLVCVCVCVCVCVTAPGSGLLVPRPGCARTDMSCFARPAQRTHLCFFLCVYVASDDWPAATLREARGPAAPWTSTRARCWTGWPCLATCSCAPWSSSACCCCWRTTWTGCLSAARPATSCRRWCVRRLLPPWLPCLLTCGHVPCIVVAGEQSKIFLDETASTTVLEAAMRAVTFYLDVSSDCTRHIVAVEGAVSAICNRLEAADLSSQVQLMRVFFFDFQVIV